MPSMIGKRRKGRMVDKARDDEVLMANSEENITAGSDIPSSYEEQSVHGSTFLAPPEATPKTTRASSLDENTLRVPSEPPVASGDPSAQERKVTKLKKVRPKKLRRRPPLIRFGRHHCKCDKCEKHFRKRGVRPKSISKLPSLIIHPPVKQVENAEVQEQAEESFEQIDKEIVKTTEAQDVEEPEQVVIKSLPSSNPDEVEPPKKSKRRSAGPPPGTIDKGDQKSDMRVSTDTEESPERTVEQPESDKPIKRHKKQASSKSVHSDAKDVHSEQMKKHMQQVKERVAQIKATSNQANGIEDSDSENEISDEETIQMASSAAADVKALDKRNGMVFAATGANATDDEESEDAESIQSDDPCDSEHQSPETVVQVRVMNQIIEEISSADNQGGPISRAEDESERLPGCTPQTPQGKTEKKERKHRKPRRHDSDYGPSAPPLPADLSPARRRATIGTAPNGAQVSATDMQPPSQAKISSSSSHGRHRKKRSSVLEAEPTPPTSCSESEMEIARPFHQPLESFFDAKAVRRKSKSAHHERASRRSSTATSVSIHEGRSPSSRRSSRQIQSAPQNVVPPSVLAAAAQGAFMVTHNPHAQDDLLNQFKTRPSANAGKGRSASDSRRISKGYARLDGESSSPLRPPIHPPPGYHVRQSMAHAANSRVTVKSSQDRFTSLLTSGQSASPAARPSQQPVVHGGAQRPFNPRERVTILEKPYTKWDLPV